MTTRRHEQQPGKRGDEVREAPPSFWEWVAAAIGLLLLVASLGYLLRDAWSGEQERPPAPRIELVAIEPQGGRFLVRLRVVNESRATASALRVEGELRRGDQVVERSAMELQYLPGRSSRKGGLFFSQDPRALQLVLSPRSYQDP